MKFGVDLIRVHTCDGKVVSHKKRHLRVIADSVVQAGEMALEDAERRQVFGVIIDGESHVRIKSIMNMDTDEKYVPQDGKFVKEPT